MLTFHGKYNCTVHGKFMTQQNLVMYESFVACKTDMYVSWLVNVCIMLIGNLFDMRQACFEYFKLGGRAVTDTVGLLSM